MRVRLLQEQQEPPTSSAGGEYVRKQHWKDSSKPEYIAEGLDWFVKNYQKLGITSIAFPALGCGRGGLSWEVVGKMMVDKLKDLPIEIELYLPDPFLGF